MAGLGQNGPPLESQGVQSLPPTTQPKHLALPLPLSPHTTLHVRLTLLETSNLIFLTTTDYAGSSTSSALGSFVYAMPNRLNPSDPLCTALFPVPSSVDFATRAAKILAKKTGKPTYVGCSATFGGATVEEEMAAVKIAVDAILTEHTAKEAEVKVNGT
ncbi:hypothetical protein MMC19_003892 [Ptychographa xylographoides]|nr:hypothetical protein [Ptychographa xylographoides]